MGVMHITKEIYRKMIERAEKYCTCYWDSIELSGGNMLTFGLQNGMPQDVEVYDMFDYRQNHDFDLDTFRQMAEASNAVCFDLLGRGYICGERVSA